MLDILTPRGKAGFGKKRDENGAFAKDYIKGDAYAVKVLFDLR